MMSPKEEALQILADPKDGDVITLYKVEYYASRTHVAEMTYTYHENTPWDEYCPSRPGGADLVNDWMAARNGHVEGRSTTELLLRAVRQGMEEDGRFFTRGEALTYAVDVTARRVKELKRRLAEEQAAIAELKEEKLRPTQELNQLQEEADNQ